MTRSAKTSLDVPHDRPATSEIVNLDLTEAVRRLDAEPEYLFDVAAEWELQATERVRRKLPLASKPRCQWLALLTDRLVSWAAKHDDIADAAPLKAVVRGLRSKKFEAARNQLPNAVAVIREIIEFARSKARFVGTADGKWLCWEYQPFHGASWTLRPVTREEIEIVQTVFPDFDGFNMELPRAGLEVIGYAESRIQSMTIDDVLAVFRLRGAEMIQSLGAAGGVVWSLWLNKSEIADIFVCDERRLLEKYRDQVCHDPSRREGNWRFDTARCADPIVKAAYERVCLARKK